MLVSRRAYIRGWLMFGILLYVGSENESRALNSR